MKKMAFVALAMLLPLLASADVETVDGITWTYVVTAGKASVGGGFSLSNAVPRETTGAVTIPSSLGGCHVTDIGVCAFSGCSGLTSVTIPSSVTSIGSSAFDGCSGLTSVTIPSSVTSIGVLAFARCSGLESVTIPLSVTSIGECAFSGCSGLTSVTIPSSVTNIGNAAFYNCTNLTSVTIPACVKQLSATFPQSYSALTNVTIAAGVTNIENGAFSGCTNLMSVTIPSGVTSIGDRSFSGCVGLESVTMPSSVTHIGNRAFYGCASLKTICVGNGGGVEDFRRMLAESGFDVGGAVILRHRAGGIVVGGAPGAISSISPAGDVTDFFEDADDVTYGEVLEPQIGKTYTFTAQDYWQNDSGFHRITCMGWKLYDLETGELVTENGPENVCTASFEYPGFIGYYLEWQWGDAYVKPQGGVEGADVEFTENGDVLETFGVGEWEMTPWHGFSAEVLIVGGGGGGGNSGGGGGGGVVIHTNLLFEGGKTYRFTVGAGGAGATANGAVGEKGGQTTFVGGKFSFTAPGGGGGGGYDKNGVAGACGGGGGINGTRSGGGGTFGKAGGGGNGYGGGGGGGMTEAGGTCAIGNTQSLEYSGKGGDGLTCSISGVERTYGSGGGGGAARNDWNSAWSPTGGHRPGEGGKDSGGRGGFLQCYQGTIRGEPGKDGMGGGGGGGSFKDAYRAGGDGGDGVVMLRYHIPALSVGGSPSAVLTCTPETASADWTPDATGATYGCISNSAVGTSYTFTVPDFWRTPGAVRRITCKGWKIYDQSTGELVDSYVGDDFGQATNCTVTYTSTPLYLEWQWDVETFGRYLPGGYEEVEYVESDAAKKQWVDTLHVATPKTRVVADLAWTKDDEFGSFGYGAAASAQSLRIGRSSAASSNGFYVVFSDAYDMVFNSKDAYTASVAPDKARHVLDVSASDFYVDGIRFGPTSSGITKTLDGSMFLFAQRWGWSPYVGQYMSVRFYGFRIYEDGVLVKDFVPARHVATGKYGMYDVVGNKFHGNLGSGGDLTGGPALPAPPAPEPGEALFDGGVAYWDGEHVVQIFTNATCSLAARHAVDAEVLVVAGGGGGGGTIGGGGGAGQAIARRVTFAKNAIYDMTVGAGGAPNADTWLEGQNGGDTTLSGYGVSIAAKGGGGGGGWYSGAGRAGGNAGGNAGNTASAAVAASVAGGHKGASGISNGWSGGGGGQGEDGQQGKKPITRYSGRGGNGLATEILGRLSYFAGGGGGGGGNDSWYAGDGGRGGGGFGGDSSKNEAIKCRNGFNGADGTGGGGGGGGYNNSNGQGGRGGSGTIIVRYRVVDADVEESTDTVDGVEWTYAIIGGATTIVGVSRSTAGAVTIPSTLDGRPVTGIGEGAFSGCCGITSVTIPSSVTSIGHGAFYGCSGLADGNGFVIVRGVLYDYLGSASSVTIPSGVTSIGASAFCGCGRIASMTIPSSVASIGDWAFCGCSSLTSITIPSSVTRIGDGAFYGCCGLADGNGLVIVQGVLHDYVGSASSVKIPLGVTSIGTSAFSGCGGITSVTLPSSVTSIGGDAFWGCSSLKTIHVGNDGDVNEVKRMLTESGFDVGGVVFDEVAIVEVSNVVSRQRYPWNGLVDIDCEVTCSDPATNVNLYLSAKDNAAGKTLPVRHVWLESDAAHTNALAVKAGKHRIVWDAGTDAPNVVSGDVTIDVLAFVGAGAGDYLVIDLSGGPNAASYPVSYLGAEPQGGWTDEYKTDKLVLRLIQPGTFMMGSPDYEFGRGGDEHQHRVTISRPFYMCVFEITQRQWELVMDGHNPSAYLGSTRPVDNVSWDAIRGNSDTYNWPTVKNVAGSSFVGKLRDKTNVDFDLPTEAQWEYACRAGVNTSLNSGKNMVSTTTDYNMSEVGRYYYNRNDGRGGYSDAHTMVGSYRPNEWGLYDMHGNVFEWCLDWYGDVGTMDIDDPVGPAFGSLRVRRSGGWHDGPVRSADRDAHYSWEKWGDYGFRLSSVLPGLANCAAATGNAMSKVMLNTRNGVRIASECEIVTYSPQWNGLEMCSVSIDGKVVVTSADEGEIEWNPETTGAHVLTHVAGGETLTAQFTVLGDDVALHAGTFATNETWGADKVHLVTDGVTVPSGKTLTIEPGAVVKFMTGTSLTVNGTCTAYGVIFTHVNDDTAGGDTLMDGGATKPVMDGYKLSGNIYEDDATEGRYLIPKAVTLSGTLSKNETWKGYKVYRVTGNLTIPSGVTLTIMPGAIVKFDAGTSLTVSSGGVLNAKGTRAQPIVFTSIKDDDWGGDTNGDGNSTVAEPGDWRNVVVIGTANFTGTKILYGGGASTSTDTGMVTVRSGGKAMFDRCSLVHGLYDGIFSYGMVTGENTIIHDCDRGVNNSGGSGVFRNCVVDLCRWGVMTEGGSGTYYNCIVTRFYGSPSWPTGWGVAYWSGSLKTYSCCVWSDLPGSSNYRSSPTTMRNVSADPKFLDPDNGDFRIAEDSPCVDAGDGTAAPKADWYGQPRKTHPLAEQTGTPDASDEYVDIGIHEVQPRNVKSDVDLAVVRVSAPERLVVGEEASVSWTVRNEGSEDAVGPWSDRIEIVCANGSAVVLGAKTVVGGLVAGGERTFTGTWLVPSAQIGPVHVRVTANAERDVFEGSLTANNSALSDGACDLELPVLEELAESESAWVAVGAQSETAFRLPTAATAGGGLLVVRAPSGVSVWTGAGQVPTADIFFAGAVKVAEDAWIVRIPDADDAYVTVRNDGGSATSVELAVEVGGFLLFDTGVVTAPNEGIVTLTLFGNGFADDMGVTLEGNGRQVSAVDLVVEDSVLASASFDVSGLPAGTYSVRLSHGGEEISDEVLELTQQKVGPKWQGKLEISGIVRSGRVYTGTFTYGNDGDVAMAAPYVVLKAAANTLIRFSEADAWGDTLEFMATSESAPASLVKPGEHRRVTFFYKTTGSSVSVTATVNHEDAHAFPWDTNGGYMRPSWATDEIWNRALATLKRNVGATWNDYLDRMRANCDHLQKIGTPTHRIDRLWQLEINEALGVDHAVRALAGGTDLARSGRGFGLSFSRSYGSGMYQRLRKGVLGYGWSDNLSVSCELQENGTRFVIQSGNGSSYGFTKASGNWAPEDARDKTRMTESATEWTLTAQSGMVVKFSKSTKRLVSVRDNMGNGIDFTWDGVATESGVRVALALPKLVRMTHTDGQWIAFTYEGDLLVSAADDQGRTTSYAYTGEMLTEVTAFNGRKVKYNYLPTDETAASRALRQIVAPDGQTKDFTYDAAGRVATASRNGSHFTSEIVRSELGSYSVIAPNGGVTEVTVGAFGETLATVNALGQKIQRTYTADTLLESVIAPSGKRSKIFYDTNGQAVKSMDAAGATTSFAYTEDFGSLKSVTDARQNAITYGYDKLGRSESVAYPDETSSRIFYAANGDVTSAVNAKGESIAYAYDKEGNKIGTTWPNGRTFAWAYDVKGNCTNASDSVTGTVTMEYDNQEQLTRITYPGNRGFTYAYDEFGRVTARTSFDGVAQKYEYDAFGRIAKMTDGVGNLYVTNAYDPVTGNLVLQTYGNGTTVSNAYDLLDRTVSITHRKADGTVMESFAYAYNEDGQRISLTTTEGVERYAYDAAGQVTGVTYPDGTEENFTYDAVGNRLATDEAIYTVNALNQYTSVRSARLSTGEAAAKRSLEWCADPTPSTPVGSAPRTDRDATFTYDLDGNLTSRTSAADGTTTYAYDCESRLIGVTNALKGIAWSCEYDVFGNRVRVTDNGVTTEKLYIQGSLPSVAAEYRGGSLVTRHILSGAVRIADIGGNTGGTGVSPVQNEESSIHYYHADGLASTRLLTDKDGSISATASYKTFGEIRASSGIAITDGYVGTLGIERDSTGLLFMRNRYYDAAMGRFVQRDPIGLRGGDVNWYRYCVNDGIGYIDPLGTATYCYNVDPGPRGYAINDEVILADGTVFVVDRNGMTPNNIANRLKYSDPENAHEIEISNPAYSRNLRNFQAVAEIGAEGGSHLNALGAGHPADMIGTEIINGIVNSRGRDR